MRRAFLAVLLLLCGPLANGDSDQLFCGHTGFNLNLGVTTKSFRCAPARVTPGLGTVTFTGVATVTVTNNGFANIAPPDALPGADGVFFKTSGLFVLVGSPAQRYMLRVSGKTDASTIAVQSGVVAPAFSGTTTTWSYWNTTCYRSAATYNDNTQATDPNVSDSRLWRHFDELSQAHVAPNNSTLFLVGWAESTSPITASAQFTARPVGMRTGTVQQSVGGGWPSDGPQTFISARLQGGGSAFSGRFSEITASISSATNDTTPVQCLYVAATE